jgi:hypothetical protein
MMLFSVISDDWVGSASVKVRSHFMRNYTAVTIFVQSEDVDNFAFCRTHYTALRLYSVLWQKN